MAITYTSDDVNTGASRLTSLTSSTLTIATDDVVIVMCVTEDNLNTGTFSISNSGTALSWNTITITNTNNDCKVGCWWAKATTTQNRTVTVSWSNTNAALLSCRVHTGAHATDPVPSGNIFSGVGGTDVSQSITPTASGSALWMACGDWGATNSFAAITNCTLEATYHQAGLYTGTIVRPTTQPRTDGSSFTIGETDTSGTIAWVAFEVQAAVTPTYEQHHYRFRADSGNEATPTWLATEDTGYTGNLDTNYLIRFQIQTTNDAPASAYQFEYKLSTDSVWRKVDVG